MFARSVKVLGASVLAVGSLASVASAAAGPPPAPKASNGAKVQTVTSVPGTVTSFAFGAGQTFIGNAGNESATPPTPGGVYIVAKDGTSKLLAGSPPFVAGLAWRHHTLYVSALNKILAWSGWNGTAFTKHRTFYSAPAGFPGFNGIAFGANGRLYAGVDVGLNNDHGPATAPFQYDLLSFGPKGKGPRIEARGMRQPWQLAFPKGSSVPFVTDFGQDEPKNLNPPDFLLRVHRGDNYGFPTCTGVKRSACTSFTQPYKKFAPHTDIGGLAIIGNRLYIGEFGFARTPLVVSMPLKGGKVTKFLTKWHDSPIGVAANGRWLYVGTAGGFVYRVHG
jgi:glucose/arabinose dehydrogenase